MTRRQLLLGAALVFALAVRFVDPWRKAEPPAIADVTAHARRVTPVATAVEADSLPPARWRLRLHVEASPIDPFAPPKPPEIAVTEAPKTPIAAPAPPPAAAPPTAPPLPYAAVGDWTDSGVTVAFLAGANGMVMAKAGETLNGVYHVDKVTPGHIMLTYVPLQQVQQLTWSSGR